MASAFRLRRCCLSIARIFERHIRRTEWTLGRFPQPVRGERETLQGKLFLLDKVREGITQDQQRANDNWFRTAGLQVGTRATNSGASADHIVHDRHSLSTEPRTKCTWDPVCDGIERVAASAVEPFRIRELHIQLG